MLRVVVLSSLLATFLALVAADNAVCSKAASVASHYATCGCPYVYGGTDCSCGGHGGLDCSGLTYVSYREAGWSGIPRTSEEQWSAIKGSCGSCSATKTDGCQPGDLFFYCFSGSGCPDHVTMYVGGGKIAECPHTGEDCHVVSSYGDAYTGCRRHC